MTPERTTVHQALAAVMADVGHVAKKDKNEAQRFMFRGIDAVVNAVGPALRTHKVVVAPTVESCTYETVQTTTGKPSTACRVVVRYTFYGPEGDSLTASVAGEAWDSGDKAAPKAMSVAFRTALLQTLALPTDEPDPDSQTYERAAAPTHPDPMAVARDRLRKVAQEKNPDKSPEQLNHWVRAAFEARGLNAGSVADVHKLAEDLAQ